jgi:ArsR family transcriptional regulator
VKASVFATLGDVSRLRILNLLAEGDRCVCELTPILGLAQPTVSRHLSVLVGQGLLKCRKVGSRMIYSLAAPEILKVLESVDESLIERLKKNVVAKMSQA